MHKETKEAQTNWINGAGPESEHPLDRERFYKLVFQCIKHNDRLDEAEIEEILINEKGWDSNEAVKFSEDRIYLANEIIHFMNYLKTNQSNYLVTNLNY